MASAPVVPQPVGPLPPPPVEEELVALAWVVNYLKEYGVPQQLIAQVVTAVLSGAATAGK